MVKDHGFVDMSTEVQPDPFGYVPAVVRIKPSLRWSDAAGPHEQAFDARAVIGSAPQSDVVLHDAAVSRLHAELTLRDQVVWVRDLESRNGIKIDGHQVSGDVALAVGAPFVVGRTVLRVTRA